MAPITISVFKKEENIVGKGQMLVTNSVLKSDHLRHFGTRDCMVKFNSILNNKILDQSELKAFADNKLKVIQMTKFVLDKIENVVGKEENAGYQHFLQFPRCLQKTSPRGLLKVRIVW